MQYNFQHTPHTQDRIIDRLSITKPGRIGLPKYFLTIHRIQPGLSAKLYWDAEAQLLAIEFTPRADPAAYPVKFTRYYGGFISGARFFRRQRLNPEHYLGRYAYTVSTGQALGIATESNIFLLDLKHRLMPERETAI